MSTQEDNATVKRYCTACGAGIRGKQSQFDALKQCPKCKESSSFIDILSPPSPQSDAADTSREFMILMVSTVLATTIFVIMLGLGVMGYVFTSLFLALLIALIGVFLIIFSVERHYRYKKVRSELDVLRESQHRGVEAIQKHNLLARDFQKLIDERKAELQANAEKWLEAQKVVLAEKQDLIRTKEALADSGIEAIQSIAEKYVKDMTSWVTKSLTSNNFATSKQKLEKAIEFCRRKGGIISAEAEAEIYQDLKISYQEVVRKEEARLQQQRIREKIREEERLQAEAERELRRIQSEQMAIEKAIAIALEKSKGQHTAEIEDLRRKLAEAEEKSKRALSMAQQTKAGHVYVISNLGSFGENVFKIGMSRRLDPSERIKELSGAAVPFEFDVHMMISCNDAPRLENVLHKKLHRHRINKVNFRKEFFRVSLDEIVKIVEENHGVVEYVATPEALEYSESTQLSGEDLEFVEGILENAQVGDDD